MVDGSYQATLRAALVSKTIDGEMLEIANRIQEIYNSLESGQCENLLGKKTVSPDADDIEEQEEGEPDSFDEMLGDVGTYIASTSSSDVKLTAEQVNLTPCYIDNKKIFPVNPPDSTPQTPCDLHDVFDTKLGNSNSTMKTDDEPTTSRFISKTSQLNTYFTSAFYRNNPDYGKPMETDGEGKKEDIKPYIIEPNGTWESIVAWGRNAKLDTEQEIAFQIMAATYVLTFIEEAVEDCKLKETKTEFLKRKKQLELLARRQEGRKNGPPRIFITGPAGAGKCKYNAIT